jgi:hypothetical protein
MNQINDAIKLLNEVVKIKSETKGQFEKLPDLIAQNEFNQLAMVQNKDLMEMEIESIEEEIMRQIEKDAEIDETKKLSSDVKKKAELKIRLKNNSSWIEKKIELRNFIESQKKNEIDTDRLKRRFRVLECFFRMEE